mmetsp:Transcript_2717/g.4782  ORF Transcript_2717/g.4782 Transcript_2717/m.4782 type:complete len:134 (-) Transcript_2717:1279-1680(-)
MRRPVIIHRALYGSVERFIAILIEHYAGKWPLWLSPRQVIVCPVSERFTSYAQEVRSQIHREHFYVDVDSSDRKLAKKIREAQLAQYNFILVVGEDEQAHQTVNIRTRDNEVHGEKAIADFISQLKQAKDSFQ